MNISIEKMQEQLTLMGQKAKKAAATLAVMKSNEKNQLLLTMAEAILQNSEAIKEANQKDLIHAKASGLSEAMLDRLALNDKRISDMADGLKVVANEEDPVNKLLSSKTRPNGLIIEKVTVPLGVIGIIYESRPNVTCDAAGICLKAGNAVILRGGSEAFNSNMIIAKIMNEAGMKAGLCDGVIQLLPWTDREGIKLLVTLDKYIDLIIPRGGEGLIRNVVANSTIPVIKHYKGVCHIFVDKSANFSMALDIIENAKCQRPGTCNAVECILVHQDIAQNFLKELKVRMDEKNVKLFGDKASCEIISGVTANKPDDYFTEFLDFAMNLKVVSDVKEAVEHINYYGSGHSESIITEDAENANFFQANCNSSAVYHNASTRFTDGGEFGMGAEIGISTDKLHARGPMGASELVIYKYIIHGQGQVRK